MHAWGLYKLTITKFRGLAIESINPQRKPLNTIASYIRSYLTDIHAEEKPYVHSCIISYL